MLNEARNPYNSRMDEITIGDKKYVSSKRAATITGYAKDYVGQLCREGRVEARLVGRNWYVLESAIREHRFGSEKEPEDAQASEESQDTQPSPVSDWEKPRYVAETPALVPGFAPKEAAEKPRPPVIADMQSAWNEWFEEKRPQAAYPTTEEADTESQKSDEEQAYMPVVTSSVSTVEESYSEETVSVIRLEEDEPAAEAPDPSKEEELVSLHRSYASRETGERVPETNVPVVDLTRTQRRRDRSRKIEDTPGEWIGVIRALSFVVAVVALLVAIVGTGNGERIFSGTSLNFGAQKAFLDYLGGTSTYENSL